MAYIVLDLEWNQPQVGTKLPRDKRSPHLPFLKNEIIQIGAVKLSDKLEVQDLFKLCVRMQRSRTLNKYVAKVTGLTQADVENGQPFSTAIARFQGWCGPGAVFLTWGYDDIPVLMQNLGHYGLYEGWAGEWYNLQLIFNHQTGLSKNQLSLQRAMEHFCIVSDRPMHDALNDAYYTAMVCQRLDIAKGIEEYDTMNLPKKKEDPTAALRTDAFPGYQTRRLALADKGIRQGFCPACGAELVQTDWVMQNREKYICLGACPEHGRFLVRLKVFRGRAASWTATRNVYTADEEALKLYALKRDPGSQLAKEEPRPPAPTEAGGDNARGFAREGVSEDSSSGEAPVALCVRRAEGDWAEAPIPAGGAPSPSAAQGDTDAEVKAETGAGADAVAGADASPPCEAGMDASPPDAGVDVGTGPDAVVEAEAPPIEPGVDVLLTEAGSDVDAGTEGSAPEAGQDARAAF